MGVVEIFRGMGKRFRVMLFIYLKVISNISAPEVSITIIHFNPIL